MGDAVWFFHHAGTQSGPLTWSELKEHAGRGEIDKDDLVWQPGMADWEPAGTVEGLFADPGSGDEAGAPVEQEEKPRQAWKPTAAKRQKPSMPAHLRAVDGTLLALGRGRSGAQSGSSRSHRRVCGSGRIPRRRRVCDDLVDDRRDPNTGAGTDRFCCRLDPYCSASGLCCGSFSDRCRNRLDGAVTVLGSTVILDGLAALVLCAGVLAAALGIGLAALGAGMVPLLIGLGALLVFVYGAAALLDASALNVKIRDGLSNTEEVIAAVAVFAKLFFLRLTPVVLAVGALAALFAAVGLLVMSLGDGGVQVWAAVAVWGRVLSVATVPVAAWIAFLVLWLPLGVARSLIASGGTESHGSDPNRE